MAGPILLSPARHPLEELAQILWEEEKRHPGSLGASLVILPSLRGARTLRLLLLERAKGEGRHGLLVPRMLNLGLLAESVGTRPSRRPVRQPDRLLGLAKLVKEQPHLTQGLVTSSQTSPLRLAAFLTEAMDDLTRHASSLAPTTHPSEPERMSASGLNLDWLQSLGSSMLSRRLEAVLTIQREYLEDLWSKNLEDPVRAQESQSIQAADSQDLGPFIARFPHVWVSLFEDATVGERHLLARLTDFDNVTFVLEATDDAVFRLGGKLVRPADAFRWQKHPSFAGARMQELAGLSQPLGSQAFSSMGRVLFPTVHRDARGPRVEDWSPQDRSFAEQLMARLQKEPIRRAEDPFHEASLVAGLARGHLAEGRTVLVVCPDAVFARLLEQMLASWGIEADSTWGIPLSHAPLYRLMGLVRDILASQEHYLAILDLLRDPHFGLVQTGRGGELAHQLEREVVQNEAVTLGLDRLVEACKRRETDLRAATPPGEESASLDGDYGPLIQVLETLKGVLEPLSRPMSEEALLDWPTMWKNCLEALLSPSDLQEQGNPRILELLGTLEAAFLEQDYPVDRREFEELFDSLVALGSFQETRNRETRVVVADPGSARFIVRDVTFLTGLVDDWFPGAEPQSPLIPNDVRPHLGMPAMTYTEGLRASFFLRLVCRDNPLVLTTHRNQGVSPALSSRFLERLLGAATLADVPTPLLLEEHPFQYVLPEGRPGLDLDRWRLDEPPVPRVSTAWVRKRMSASQLESYLQCPYRYYCQRVLALEPEEEVIEALTARDYGTTVHRILRAFHDKDRTDLDGVPGPWLGELDKAGDEPVELLQQIALHEFGDPTRLPLSERLQVEAFLSTVPAIIDKEKDRWASGWRPMHLEKDFRLEIPECGFEFRARVDRVDRRASDGALAVLDYKTGGFPSQEELKSGTYPQLFLYALAVEAAGQDGETVLQMDYYGLKPGTRIGPGGFETGKGLTPVAERRLALKDLYGRLIHQVASDLTQPDETTFPAIPGDACTYCNYAGVCRKGEVSHGTE